MSQWFNQTMGQSAGGFSSSRRRAGLAGAELTLRNVRTFHAGFKSVLELGNVKKTRPVEPIMQPNMIVTEGSGIHRHSFPHAE